MWALVTIRNNTTNKCSQNASAVVEDNNAVTLDVSFLSENKLKFFKTLQLEKNAENRVLCCSSCVKANQ